MSIAPVHFDAELHEYTRQSTGEKLPSVTTILRDLAAVEYAAVGREVMERAALLGTAVHYMIELDCRGDLDDTNLDAQLLPYLAQWRRFLALSGFEPILSEAIVYSDRFGYAGKLDLFGNLRGRHALIDAKRTARVPRTAGPQTAGYGLALRESRPDLGRAPIDRYALHLKPGDATGFRLVPFTDPGDERVFLASLTCYRWRKSA